jgi:hypothetical protein
MGAYGTDALDVDVELHFVSAPRIDDLHQVDRYLFVPPLGNGTDVIEYFHLEYAPIESLLKESKILASEQLGARKGGVWILRDFEALRMQIVVESREKREESTWFDGSQ